MGKKTFISFIGKGQREKRGDNTSPYKKAKYDFGGGVVRPAKCFAEAVRESGLYKFDEVLFVGTPTSSWSALLENVAGAEDLCLELFSRESDGAELAPEDAARLESSLSGAWGNIPVRLHLNEADLLPENAESIFDGYVGKLLDSGDDILLDITHSFRWMPLLLTSALRFRDAFGSRGGGIQIIYGEFRGEEENSPVRCLDVLVKERKIAEAISLFFEKFEPGPLADALEPHWKEGAAALRTFGTHIQGNLFLPLLFNCGEPGFKTGAPLNRLKNALNAFDPAGKPNWAKQVHRKLVELHRQLIEGDAPGRLRVLARLLADRKLYGQAILVVCLAMEHSLALAHDHDMPPDKTTLKELKKKFRAVARGEQIKWLDDDIADMRNLIAHGGLLRDRTNPSPEALSSQFKNALARQEELQTYLETQYHAARSGGKKKK